jgi:hypothetical protein
VTCESASLGRKRASRTFSHAVLNIAAALWCCRIDQHGAPILQGRRSTFLGSLGTEARLLGVTIRLASEVVKYWDSNEEPAVVLRGGETLRADVSSRNRFGLSWSHP